MVVRMERTSPEERARLARAANTARRGSTDDPASVARRVTARAIGLSTSFAVSCAEEDALSQLLGARQIVHQRQVAVDSYNLDFTVGPIAVEVHRSSNYPFASARLCHRTEYLLRLGWDVLYLWLTEARPITDGGVDQVVAYAQRSQRHPSAIRECWVVRGGGEYVTTARCDDDQFRIDPPTRHREGRHWVYG